MLITFLIQCVCCYRLDVTGSVSTLAGAPLSAGYVDGKGTNAKFNNPQGLALSSGVLYVADSNNNVIRKVTLAGEPTPHLSRVYRVLGSSIYVCFR